MSRGWQTRRLGDLAELITKGTTPTSIGHAFVSAGVTFVKVESLSQGGEFIASRLAYITEECHATLRRSQLKAGDILFSIAGALGRTAMVTEDILPANTNQALALIRLRRSQDVLPEFVLKALATGLVLEQVEKSRGGVAQQNLSLAQVQAMTIPIPPPADQRRIVAILDEAFEGIATAKANAERNLQNARELFQSHAKSVFLQGAEHWPTRTLDQISMNLDSRRVPITKSDRKPGEFPYYGASGIVDYVADYIFEGDTLLISEDGANLLARSTPIAFSASGRYWVNNHAHILKFAHMATQRFVEFYLESIPLDEYITGAAQPKLNQKALNSIPIPIPGSSDEQAQVVDRLERVAAQSELLQALCERKLAALDELKKVLLSRAFNGELTEKSTDKQVAEVA